MVATLRVNISLYVFVFRAARLQHSCGEHLQNVPIGLLLRFCFILNQLWFFKAFVLEVRPQH